MRAFKAILTAVFLWTCIGPSGRALAATIDFEVNATVTVTNVNGTTNGQTITYSTDARTWTNNPTVNTLKFIQATNSIGFVSTNLALHFVRAPFGDGVSMSGSGTNFIKFLSQLNSNLTISLSPGWATVVYKTNNYTNQVPVSAPIIAEPNPVVATNIISGIIEAFPWATNSVPEFIAALSNYVSLSATQTLTAKTVQGGSITGAVLRSLIVATGHIDHAYNMASGGDPLSQGTGIRFYDINTNVFTMLSWNGEDPYILYIYGTNTGGVITSGPAVDISSFSGIAPTLFGSSLILNVRSALKMFPILDSVALGAANQWTNTWFTQNTWSNAANEFKLPTKFSGGINVTGAVSTITNANGAFVGLTVTNLQGLGGYLSNLFFNATTMSNAPVVHVLNLQALSGYGSNIFFQSITLSNAASINGIIGLLTGGSWSNATINGLAASNSVWSGTNVVTGDISYPWFDLSSIGAGNNIAVPLGTNTFVALSGNGGAAALCGFAGLRNGKPVKLLNRSGFAMSLVQTTIDPVPANRIVGNIAGDLAFNPGEWVDIVWDNAAARWRFVVPLAAGTNFVTSGRNDTNLSVFPSSSNNVPLTVYGTLNQSNSLQQWRDVNSNVVALISPSGGLNALGLSTNTGQQSQWIAASNITATASNTTSTPLIAVGVGGGLSNLVAVRQGPAIVGGFDSNGIPFVAPSNSAKIFPSVGRIAIQNVDTTTTNTTSETAIISPNIGSTNLDAGTFEIARVIDIYDSGEIWLTSGTTKRFFVRVGGNIAASGQLTVGGAVNQARYELRSKVFVVTKGSSGQIRGEGSVVAFSANGVNFSCNLTNTTVNMNLTTNIDLSVAFTAGATTDSVISKGAIVSEIP